MFELKLEQKLKLVFQNEIKTNTKIIFELKYHCITQKAQIQAKA